jgi:hypothetical protein
MNLDPIGRVIVSVGEPGRVGRHELVNDEIGCRQKMPRFKRFETQMAAALHADRS